MTINISIPETGPNLRPQITVIGVGGSGGNAVNNMMHSNLEGVDFLIANTDAQALQISNCERKIQLGVKSTRGLGAGMRPDVGREAAEETIDEISEKLEGSHMLFVAAGMGGGTGTGAAPVIAKLAREKGILTVGVVTKPFHFEGTQRMKLADKGIQELQQYVDTLLIIPNQNLFRIANEKTTFADAFKMADDVLYAGVRGVTDLMVQPGLINLDFSDVKTVMSEMGKAMMGTGEASGEGRAVAAAEAAISNPLIDDVSLKGARGLIINITGGQDITLYEVDEAANRVKQEVDESANIIYGTTCDDRLEGLIRVSIVATGIDVSSITTPQPLETPAVLSIDNSVYQQKTYTSNNNEVLRTEVYSESIVDKINNETDSSLEETIKESDSSLPNLEETNNEVYSESIVDKINNETDSLPEETIKESNQSLSNLEETNFDKENLESFKENETEENLEFSQDVNIERNEKIEHSAEKTSVAEDILSEKEESELVESNTTVKRLSLFDTLNEEASIDKTEHQDSEKSKLEPTLEEKHEPEETNEESNPEEFSSEEDLSEEDFNQETEEELLDIPTFLRRQAN